jgi:hypothetical protein
VTCRFLDFIADLSTDFLGFIADLSTDFLGFIVDLSTDFLGSIADLSTDFLGFIVDLSTSFLDSVADLSASLRRFVRIPKRSLVSHDTVLLYMPWYPARGTTFFLGSYDLLSSQYTQEVFRDKERWKEGGQSHQSPPGIRSYPDWDKFGKPSLP